MNRPAKHLIDTSSHPLDSGFVYEWASGWGFDEYGIFVDFTLKGIEQRLRWCPPGEFLMGSHEDEPDRLDRESPQITVALEEGFWLFDAPVTQALYEAVTGSNPSDFKSPDRPVEQVSWNDAQTFLERLNAEAPGLDLHLPSEAQWEYACRAGTATATYVGDNSGESLDEIAWYGGNSGFETHAVKQKRPNAWGLHDMLGNVLEWCEDAWSSSHEGAFPFGAPRSLAKTTGGRYRLIRGGSWDYDARDCRAADRFRFEPGDRFNNLGFRPARGQVKPAGSSEVCPAWALDWR